MMPSSPPKRESLHIEPQSVLGAAQHYIRDLVYGANDGVITTFAVVAGVTGGTLSPVTVLVLGVAKSARRWTIDGSWQLFGHSFR